MAGSKWCHARIWQIFYYFFFKVKFVRKSTRLTKAMSSVTVHAFWFGPGQANVYPLTLHRRFCITLKSCHVTNSIYLRWIQILQGMYDLPKQYLYYVLKILMCNKKSTIFLVLEGGWGVSSYNWEIAPKKCCVLTGTNTKYYFWNRIFFKLLLEVS